MKKKFDLWVYTHPTLKKLIMELKIAFLLILVSVSNVLAIPTYSQVAKVSLDAKNKSLEQVMDEIENQSEFYFVFNQKQIDVNRVVDIQAENKLITDILPELFKGTNVNYIVFDRKILLTTDPLENNLLAIASGTELQQKQITGTVTDKDGAPLPGVNVVVIGTTQGTITDVDGKYSIEVPQGARSLTFSFVGMVPQEIIIGTLTQINVTMVESAIGLEEVVVVGYGTVKKADLTGSVGSIDISKALQEVKVTNVEEFILGKIAGVQIKQRDGAPGQPPQIIIRGIGSITAGTKPLYIVDGFPVEDLETLNPENVETLDILKDASATAIYGSRGSNGVVIITTKRGQAGRPIISFDASIGMQKLLKRPNYMNAAEQARWAYWGAYFRNIDDGYPPTGNPLTWHFPCPPVVLDIVEGRPAPDVDWIDAIMRTAPVARYQLSTSGGNEVVKFAISGEYLDQEGIIKNSSFKRYSLQANFDAQLSKRLAVKVNLNPSFIEEKDIVYSPGGVSVPGELMRNVTGVNPYNPIYNEDGSYFIIRGIPETENLINAVALVDNLLANSRRARFMGNIMADYTILDGLKFNIMLGGNFASTKAMQFMPKLPSLLNSSPTGSDAASLGFNWINEYSLTYNKNIGDHQLTGLAVFSAEKSVAQTNSISSNAYPNNLVPYLSAVGGILTGGTSNLSEWSLVSYLARLNYNYQSKYYVTTSIRTDGSSRFGSKNRYGLFPSLAFAWRISNERFLKDVSFLTNLKLRISYGQTGNNNIGNYDALPTINNVKYPWGENAVGGYIQARIPNPDLTWEKQESFNVGIDASFFKGRLGFSVDRFNTKNKGLLLNVNIPYTTGFSSALQNIGQVDNKGWELIVNTVNLEGKFTWSTVFNISSYKNEVVSLGPEGDPILVTRHITMIGQPIGMMYGYVQDGIFETTAELEEGPLYNPGVRNGTRVGDIKFKDVSGPDGVPDGLINSYDRTIIGNPYPDYFYGMTNRFSYKNFRLSISLQGVNGNMIASQARIISLRGEFRAHQLALNNNFWISEEEPGDGNTPRPNDEPTGGIREFSTRHLEDGSYLRINNISLSYTAPVSFCQRLKLNSLRVYVNATNPFLFSKTENFNPDVNNLTNALSPGEDNNNYPLPKCLSLGLNFVF